MLKKYLSQEEFAPIAEVQDEEAVADYILAEKEAESGRSTRTTG